MGMFNSGGGNHGSTHLNRPRSIVYCRVIAILMIAIMYPGSEVRLGDTNNAGPSVKTVTPTPVPPTSPAAPNPTTEPR